MIAFLDFDAEHAPADFSHDCVTKVQVRLLQYLFVTEKLIVGGNPRNQATVWPGPSQQGAKNSNEHFIVYYSTAT